MQSLYDRHIRNVLRKAKSHEPRHVKGHVKRKDWLPVSKRNYTNDWADKHARKLLPSTLRM
jgi:hypothetical protein